MIFEDHQVKVYSYVQCVHYDWEQDGDWLKEELSLAHLNFHLQTMATNTIQHNENKQNSQQINKR